jgi:hypothetical protein
MQRQQSFGDANTRARLAGSHFVKEQQFIRFIVDVAEPSGQK